jgi:large subunit ribosomal protein L2
MFLSSKKNSQFRFDLKKRTRKLFSGYRDVSFFKNNLPLLIKGKRLYFRRKSNSGRSNEGRIILWTKSSFKKRITRPSINYSFRSLKVGFISSIYLLPLNKSPVALYQLSDGSYSYIKPTLNSKLFILTRMEDLLKTISTRSHLNSYLGLLYTQFYIKPSLFIIRKLPRNQFMSLVELYPSKGIQYIRAPGSKAKILKMDTRTSTAVIKLPSGVKKIFSIYSLASLGQVLLSEKKLYKNNKAGYNNNLGYKPRVRGVAMNPVDHPHGGRAKAIRYQRTP